MKEQWDKWVAGLVDALPQVVFGVILAIAAVLLARLARRIARRATQAADLAPGIARVITRAVYSGVLVIGLIVAVAVGLPGMNLAAAFGALGIGSIIAGFALKDIIENWVAGTLILFTRPFEIGDQITTGEHEGTVRDIQFRATILRTPDNEAVVIPNSELYTSRVTVNTHYDQVRQRIDVVVPNLYPIEELRTAITDEVASCEGVSAEPGPDVIVTELGDYSTTLTVRFWVGPPSTRTEVSHATDRVLTGLFRKLGEMDIRNIRPESAVFVHTVSDERSASAA